MLNPYTIELAGCTPRGLEKLISWANDAECKEFFRHFPPRLEWTRSQSFLETLLSNSFEVKKSDEIVGLAYFYDHNHIARSVAVALIVPHPDHKAITDEIYKQIQSYVFLEKDFNRIECTIMEHRTGLKARLEALGFVPEGLLRQSCRLDDSLRSEWLMGLTRSDYKR